MSGVMEAEHLVDAALVGFDRKELVTIPPVPDVAAWEAFEHARGVLARLRLRQCRTRCALSRVRIRRPPAPAAGLMDAITIGPSASGSKVAKIL